jgi:hypothetical protein
MNIWVNKPQGPEGIGICRKMAINKLEVQRTGTLDDRFGALHLRTDSIIRFLPTLRCSAAINALYNSCVCPALLHPMTQ